MAPLTPCDAHAIVPDPISEVSDCTVNEAPSLRPVAPLGHIQSLSSNLATAYDTDDTDDVDELAIDDVDSSLSFSSSIALSRPMAPVGHTESAQVSLARAYDTDFVDRRTRDR